jgi:hypothetical protein
MHFQS